MIPFFESIHCCTSIHKLSKLATKLRDVCVVPSPILELVIQDWKLANNSLAVISITALPSAYAGMTITVFKNSNSTHEKRVELESCMLVRDMSAQENSCFGITVWRELVAYVHNRKSPDSLCFAKDAQSSESNHPHQPQHTQTTSNNIKENPCE